MSHPIATLVVAALISLSCVGAHAADYTTEYDKKVKAAQDVGVLGDGLAGDQLNFYTGATSFKATDVSLPSNHGLPISIGRSFSVETNRQRAATKGTLANPVVVSPVKRPFGDWDLDIPHIRTVMTQANGWVIDSATPQNRCSIIGQTRLSPYVPSGSPSLGVPANVPKELGSGSWEFTPDQYWNGYELEMPGGASQHLLAAALPNAERPSTGTYHWTTNNDWWVSCLPTIANGTGEGFLAVAPDGSKYTFNWLSKRNIENIHEAVYIDEANPGAGVRHYYLYRAEYRMLPTRIEDRFGNAVVYTWADVNGMSRLTSIDSTSDTGGPMERRITLGYDGNGFISTIKDGTDTAYSRLWTYQYAFNDNRPSGGALAASPTLTSVTLPDGSQWTYGFSGLAELVAALPFCGLPVGPPPDFTCYGGGTAPSTPSSAYVVHPSGARVDFSFDNHFQATQLEWFYPLGLKEKTISGPGLAAATWKYSFSPTKDVAKAACIAGQCPTRVITDQIDPDGSVSRRVFGINADVDETLLLGQMDGALTANGGGSPAITSSPRWGTDVFDDPIAGTSTVPVFYKDTSIDYAPWNQPSTYTAQVGVSSLSAAGGGGGQVTSAEFRSPETKRTITQQGVTFVWQVDKIPACLNLYCFDLYAKPLQTTHFSTGSAGGNGTRTEQRTYENNTAKWVIGQVKTVKDVLTNQVVSQTDYDGNAMPWKTYSFGIQQQELTYEGAVAGAIGTLKSITDGRGYVTGLSNWKRGIPQTITYPTLKVDGITHVAESAVVNAIGQLASTTDELSNTTSYSYDAMGRLSGIAYPTPDIVAWNGTTRSFASTVSTEYGITGRHWKQVVQTGNGRTTTLYDGKWQPVLVITEDTALPASKTFVVTRYDSSGRPVFSSYPVGSLTSVNDSLTGTRTFYDALGRPIKTEQDAESPLNVLTSTTEYLTGFQTRTTNPRGKQTTTTYQLFDSPSTDAPVSISLPQGVTTMIVRQPSLGKPLSVTRAGMYAGGPVSAIRSYVYDNNERLCKTINPESNATVVNYDPAGNIDWSADGTAYTSTLQTSCNIDRGNVAAGAKTTRSYDALNRVTAITTPGNAADTTSTYDYAGKVISLTAANPGGLVTTSYTYGTKRGLLTGESSTHLGNTFSLGYGYDANANLKQLTYPDGHTVAYAPDALGRATAVTGSGGLGTAQTYASAITYHPGGAIAGFNYGNGVVHAMTQNARKLPAHSTDTFGTFKVIDDTTVFDQNGNVDYVTDIAGTGNQNRSKDLGYDDLDRLIVADAPNQWGSATYAYDPIDNIRSADQGARQYRYNYNATSNLLTDIKTPAGATVFGFTYDARGNTTAKGAKVYTFDVANRMSAVNGLQSYLYDGQGRRVRTIDADTKVTQWIYSQSGQVVYTDEGRRNKLLNYIYLGNTQVAVRSVDKASSALTVTYQHTDALGSPVAETPSAAPTAGNTVRHSYAPYGEGYGEPTGGSVDGTGYTGHVMDRGTGLTYMQQRYYDPESARFLSTDPLPAKANDGYNFNAYRYANDNPFKFTDPDGRAGHNGRENPQSNLSSLTVEQKIIAIDLVAKEASIDRHGRPAAIFRGEGAVTNINRTLIGDREFSSKSNLAATLGHEVVHDDQIDVLQGEMEIDDVKIALNEVEAYDFNIRNARRVGNTPAEVAKFKFYRAAYQKLAELRQKERENRKEKDKEKEKEKKKEKNENRE